MNTMPENKTRKIRNRIMTAIALASTKLVFAEGALDSLVTSIKGIYSDLIPVITALAVVALIICAACYFLSKNERRADEAFQWGKRILIGFVIVVIAPWLLYSLIDLLGDGVTGTSIDDLTSLVQP